MILLYAHSCLWPLNVSLPNSYWHNILIFLHFQFKTLAIFTIKYFSSFLTGLGKGLGSRRKYKNTRRKITYIHIAVVQIFTAAVFLFISCNLQPYQDWDYIINEKSITIYMSDRRALLKNTLVMQFL